MNERSDVTTDPKDNKGIRKEYYKKLDANKFNNVSEMDKFFEKYKQSSLKMNQIT